MFLNVQLQEIEGFHRLQSIISKDSENLEKTTLNACDLWSLGQHCIKNRHQTVKDFTTSAQEHFGKPLSVNTVKTLPCKAKALSTTSRHVAGFSEPELIWDGLKRSGKVCRALTRPRFKLFSGPKRKRTILIVISAKFKNQHLWWYRGELVPMASWVTFTSAKAPSMLKGTCRFWSIMLPSKQRLFQGRPCLFMQDNAEPHSAGVTTADCWATEVVYQARMGEIPPTTLQQ